ncbi:MAG: efflux RND transporter permease subunit [Aestuariivita sp.]|nr:efflux RND transporter permease subunit [Aestuariivita sp.]
MNIARTSIDRPILTWLIILSCLIGGAWGFDGLGRLEDPAFTIKSAVISINYIGASADEVAREISDPIESEIQKMSEVDEIQSVNTPGNSRITVNIQEQYGGDELLKIWSKLRNRVAEASLPSGASKPSVNDSFGDVFGLYYAVTTPGFDDHEIHDIARFIRLKLLTVGGVADINIQSLPEEVIYVEPYAALASNLDIPPITILNALETATSISDGGSVQSNNERTLIMGPQGSSTVEEIAGLTIGASGQLVNLIDFAEVYRARKDTPNTIIRFNGNEAFTVGIAAISTENIVEIGARVDQKLAELLPQLPVGVQLHPIYQQHKVVEKAINDFWINLAMSVGIVVIVLALFMGWRAAVVVGSTLFLTVIGTLLFMALFSIEMERISLGALIIAMGMLVDNAIVIAEGMQVAMRNGRSSRDAAAETADKVQVPLLGATIIAILAFAGIGLSTDAVGEFLFSLFAVIAISLTLSWVLAMSVTPLLGHYFFVSASNKNPTSKPGLVFLIYEKLLRACFKVRWLVILLLIAFTATCFALFGQLKQQFFPDSNTPIFFVDYKLAQGASIHKTSNDLLEIEAWLAKQPSVVSTTAFVGRGASRFMLTYQSEDPNPSYGHLIVRAETLESITPLIDRLEKFTQNSHPHGTMRAYRLAFGPGGGKPIQVRYSGADPVVLRNLANQALETLSSVSTSIVRPSVDWHQLEQVLRPLYAIDRAQEAGINRDNVTQILLYATEGVLAGFYREQERQIPIVVRSNRGENISLSDQVIYSQGAGLLVPFEQVTDGLIFEGQNTILKRRDREFTITVEADVLPGKTAAETQAEIHDAIEALVIPTGYKMEWGGEYENSRNAQASLGAQLPISLILMIIISILLFNAIRQPLIIWLLIPLSINGVVLALLGSDLPFTFTALLGLLSLSGMLIKNGIVLVEEIDLTRKANPNQPLSECIIKASASRLRPVILAATTTIFGMIPLIADAFFRSMAVTIMGGLAFASLLTLVAAPILYLILFSKISRHSQANSSKSNKDFNRNIHESTT